MQTSKYGKSVLTKSPTRMLSFRCSGLEIARSAANRIKLALQQATLATYLPCTRFVSSAAIRGSISTAVHDLHFSKIRTVKLPVPGPTSRTTSEGRKFALSTMLWVIDKCQFLTRRGVACCEMSARPTPVQR